MWCAESFERTARLFIQGAVPAFCTRPLLESRRCFMFPGPDRVLSNPDYGLLDGWNRRHSWEGCEAELFRDPWSMVPGPAVHDTRIAQARVGGDVHRAAAPAHVLACGMSWTSCQYWQCVCVSRPPACARHTWPASTKASRKSCALSIVGTGQLELVSGVIVRNGVQSPPYLHLMRGPSAQRTTHVRSHRCRRQQSDEVEWCRAIAAYHTDEHTQGRTALRFEIVAPFGECRGLLVGGCAHCPPKPSQTAILADSPCGEWGSDAVQRPPAIRDRPPLELA